MEENSRSGNGSQVEVEITAERGRELAEEEEPLTTMTFFCIIFRPFGHCHLYPTCTRCHCWTTVLDLQYLNTLAGEKC